MIAGLTKLTLLDYPGKVGCILFTQGCNLQCPFCHNSSLIGTAENTPVDTAEILKFLDTRRGLIDGVCISGGEPTLHPDLLDLLKHIKDAGYAVKLDTNGSHPEILQRIQDRGLADYIAMDVKNSPDLYSITTGRPDLSMVPIEDSIRIILQSGIQYEFRTTIVGGLHTVQSVQSMGYWVSTIGIPEQWFLQPYQPVSDTCNESLWCLSEPTLAAMKAELQHFAKKVTIRTM